MYKEKKVRGRERLLKVNILKKSKIKIKNKYMWKEILISSKTYIAEEGIRPNQKHKIGGILCSNIVFYVMNKMISPQCYFPTSHQVNHLSKVMETT